MTQIEQWIREEGIKEGIKEGEMKKALDTARAAQPRNHRLNFLVIDLFILSVALPILLIHQVQVKAFLQPLSMSTQHVAVFR